MSPYGDKSRPLSRYVIKAAIQQIQVLDLRSFYKFLLVKSKIDEFLVEQFYKCCTYLLFIQENKVLWHRPMDDEAIKLLRAFFSHEKGADITNAS